MDYHSSFPHLDKCKKAILAAFDQLGGRAERGRIVELASKLGNFTAAERSVPAPPSHRNYGTYLSYRLSWALTHLRQDGAVENPERGWWELAA